MITDEQLLAIQDNSKFILVKAGAGTGKTEVMTRRIINLLDQNSELSLQDMAVITFTNKATENLLARLKMYLYQHWKNADNEKLKKRFRYEVELLNSCQISTIHKFCKSILDQAGPLAFNDFNYSPAFKVTGSSLNRAIELTLENWIKSKEEKQIEIEHEKYMPIHNLKNILENMYNMIRSQGYSVERVIQQTSDNLFLETGTPRKIKLELLELLTNLAKNHYELRLTSLDPDDLLEFCYKLLDRNSALLNQIQNKYKYIFVDEFQDTSLFQTGILKKICDGSNHSPSLFVVGDSKQSIYQFRGADLNSYQSMERWIKRHGKVLTLSTNFRSTCELVYFVNQKFKTIKEKNPDLRFNPEPLKPSNDCNDPIDYKNAFTWLLAKKDELQSDLIASYIKEKINEGRSANDFAILFRKNFPMLEFAKSLEEKGVPYRLIGAGNFYNQREIIDTYKVLCYLLSPQSDLIRNEALDTMYFLGDEAKLNHLIQSTSSELNKRTPAQILEFIYENTKIRERISKSLPQAVANLNKLKELTRKINLKENLQLHEFTRWLQLKIVTHEEEQQADVPISQVTEAVTLISIHRAKGLEYPVVILPYLDHPLSKGVLFPSVVYNKETGLEFNYTPYFENRGTRIPSSSYSATIEEYHKDLFSEELRILYVSLTRAEEHLVLVGSEECPKKSVCFQNWLQTD